MNNKFVDLNIKKYYNNSYSYRVLDIENSLLNDNNYVYQIYSVLKVFFEATLLKFIWNDIYDFKSYLSDLSKKMKKITFVIETKDHVDSKFLCLEEFIV